MSLQREFFSGDRGRFAFKVSFHPDPDTGAGVSPEEAKSWGSFELWIGGQNLCEHTENGEILSGVHWYMLPLLEWLVQCWDSLLHEKRLPVRTSAPDAWMSMSETAFPPPGLSGDQEELWTEAWKTWWKNHCFLACRNGGLFPNVYVRRWQDLIEISWGSSRLAGQPSHFRFLASKGFKRYEPADIGQALYDVIEASVSHLLRELPDSERIAMLEKATKKIRLTPRTDRLAILSGFSSKQWAAIQESARHAAAPEAFDAVFSGDGTDLVVTGGCSAALMFGSTSPTLSQRDISVLAGKLIELFSPTGQTPALEKLVQDEPIEDNNERPWKQGYMLADDVLEELTLPLGGDDAINIESVCERLGIRIQSIRLEDNGIRALAVAGPQHVPAILINEDHATSPFPSGRRFSIAHELCHLLFDRSYGAKLAIASGPWAPRDLERRANSFAAEFLMPPSLIRRAASHLNVPLDTRQGIIAIARRLITSFTATLEHLANSGFISDVDRERIRNEADERTIESST